MTAIERLTRKVDRIVAECEGDAERIDQRVNNEINAQEILTLGLMPVSSKLRTYVVGCFIRATARTKRLNKLDNAVEGDDLVPVEIHGGGKCKITVFMTREAADRERMK